MRACFVLCLSLDCYKRAVLFLAHRSTSFRRARFLRFVSFLDCYKRAVLFLAHRSTSFRRARVLLYILWLCVFQVFFVKLRKLLLFTAFSSVVLLAQKLAVVNFRFSAFAPRRYMIRFHFGQFIVSIRSVFRNAMRAVAVLPFIYG